MSVQFAIFLFLLIESAFSYSRTTFCSSYRIIHNKNGLKLQNDDNLIPSTPKDDLKQLISNNMQKAIALVPLFYYQSVKADDEVANIGETTTSITTSAPTLTKNTRDYKSFRLPYQRENLSLGQFLGKASIVFNMKLDDPQTITQYPNLVEIYDKYKDQGLAMLCFPSEQGYFEPDDDETCRAKSKEYFKFGDWPEGKGTVFDKVDFIGPSAHPLYQALTSDLQTPNGYGRITLNYEKFLLDADGRPLRRYPRKYPASSMEADIEAALKGDPLPEETPMFQKMWREAKREAVKSEYAFRLNYNYYVAPDSMYKYDPGRDVKNG